MATGFKSKFPPQSPPPPYEERVTQGPQLSILLVSKTGSGKSTLGNALLGFEDGDAVSSFNVTTGMASAPASCKKLIKTINGKQVSIVDTPGTLDTRSPGQALKEIAKAIVLSPTGFHVILLVIRLDARFTQEEETAVDLLTHMFGDQFYRFCIIVFSHGDSINNDEQKFTDVVRTLSRENPFFNELLHKCGDRVAMIHNGRAIQREIRNRQVAALYQKMEQLVTANNGGLFSNEFFALASERLRMGQKLLKEEKKRLEKEFEEKKALLEKNFKEQRKADCDQFRYCLDTMRADFKSRCENLERECEERITAEIAERMRQRGSSCFPGDASVQTPSGRVRMSELQLGQQVLAQGPDGRPVYSPVFTWAHRLPLASPSAWVQVRTASGARLTLSSDHLLQLATADGGRRSAAARQLRPGESAVWTLDTDGRRMRRDLVTEARTEPGERSQRGLFAPLTLCGNLIVDGVLASCYVDCGLPDPLMHGLLWPVRTAWRLWPAAMEAVGSPKGDGDGDGEGDGMPGWVRAAVKHLLPALRSLVSRGSREIAEGARSLE